MKKTNKMKFKKGDQVIVIAGKDKGKSGHIIKVKPQTMQVIVEGVNLLNKRFKPTMDNPQHSVVQTEYPIHVSNVSHVDPRTGLRTKIGYKFNADGSKVRVSKSTGEQI